MLSTKSAVRLTTLTDNNIIILHFFRKRLFNTNNNPVVQIVQTFRKCRLMHYLTKKNEIANTCYGRC